MSEAVIFGCEGLVLTAWEKAFFRETTPLGFIVFSRNIDNPGQLLALTESLRATVGWRAPVLIDQEGGRVQRLRPPHWQKRAPAERFSALAAKNLPLARQAVWLNHRLMAAELQSVGIDVDCAPVLDLRIPGAHDVIGDRAFGETALQIADLGRAAAEGLLAGGVLPIMKHIPGHGRSMVDSHHALPSCDTSRAELEATDFAPFRLLRDLPWAMTAHLLYRAFDAEHPATTSRIVINEVIRGHMGFDGVLLSDDLSMQALGGTLRQRALASLQAGCDLVLHCNGKADEMEQVRAGLLPMTALAAARVKRTLALIAPPQPFDVAGAEAQLNQALSAL